MRERLPDRRSSITEKIVFTTASGSEQPLLITLGLDPATDRVREVFTASFKVGTDMNAVVSDACVMMSLLMQHGYTPKEISDKLGSPPSLLGAIILAAVQVDEEKSPCS